LSAARSLPATLPGLTPDTVAHPLRSEGPPRPRQAPDADPVHTRHRRRSLQRSPRGGAWRARPAAACQHRGVAHEVRLRPWRRRARRAISARHGKQAVGHPQERRRRAPPHRPLLNPPPRAPRAPPAAPVAPLPLAPSAPGPLLKVRPRRHRREASEPGQHPAHGVIAVTRHGVLSRRRSAARRLCLPRPVSTTACLAPGPVPLTGRLSTGRGINLGAARGTPEVLSSVPPAVGETYRSGPAFRARSGRRSSPAGALVSYPS
jgi:hypothetical protein